MSIKIKLFCILLLTNLVFSVVFAFYSHQRFDRVLREELVRRAESVSEVLARGLSDHLEVGAKESAVAHWLLRNSATSDGIDVTIGGTLVAHSKFRKDQSLNVKDDWDVELTKNILAVKDRPSVLKIFKEIKVGDKIMGEMTLLFSFQELDTKIALEFIRQMKILFAQMLMVSLFAHLFLSLAFRRVQSLVVACTRIGQGNFSDPIHSVEKDELGVVSRALDLMVEQLKAAVDERDHERLRAAEKAKFSSLGEMAAGIAHEINNPLAIIKGFVYQLKSRVRGGLDPEVAIEKLTSIDSTVDRIAKIVKALRSYTRNDENDPFVMIGFSEIVEDVLALCQERFKQAGIDLEVVIPAGLFLECHSTQVSQALLNLLNNSSDAIATAEVKWIKLTVEDTGDCLRISVTDSGPRIPDDVQEKLMTPFYTTKAIGKGTGLGLSFVMGIAEAHHGQFYLNSKHKNTQFILVLPKERAKPDPSAARAA